MDDLETVDFSDLRLDLIGSPLLPHRFSPRLLDGLRKNDVATIGQLVDLLLRRKSIKGLTAGLRDDLDAVLNEAEARTRIGRFWQYEVPSAEELTFSVSGLPHLPVLMEFLIKNLLENHGDRTYDVLARRIGLDGHRVHSLEDIACLHGVSNQTIVHKEREGKYRFINFVRQQKPERFEKFLHPLVQTEMDAFVEGLRGAFLLLTPDDLTGFISQRYHVTELTQSQKNALFFLLEISGITPIRASFPSYSGQTLWLTDASQKERVTLTEQWIVQRFKKQIVPISLEEIVIQINKSLRHEKIKIPLPVVEEVLRVSAVVETCDCQTYRTAFDHLPSDAFRAHRILHEKEKPMSLADLTRELNHQRAALGGKNVVSPTALANQLCLYDGVVAEGKSRWMLREWGREERPIVQVMEAFFHLHNRPAQPEEVFDYVQQQRQAARNSIITYLNDKSRFRQSGPQEYVLASWSRIEYPEYGKAGRGRHRFSQKEFDEAITTVFASAQTAAMPFPALTAELCKTLSCGDVSARNYVKASSVVQLVLHDNGINYDVCLREPETCPVTSKIALVKEKPKTQTARIQELVYKTLLNAPANGLQSADLVRKVVRETGLPDTTVYFTLQKMRDAVERTVDGNKIIYKMKQKSDNAQ